MRRLVAWILVAFTLHPTFPALAVETLRKDGSAYFVDKDGDLTHDTDDTERYVDFLHVEVPGDYANVQAALDGSECKKGTTTPNQGCHIHVAPGVYAEKFEISDASVTANQQASIIIEGSGPGGQTTGTVNLCATTFTGDGTSGHSVISSDDAFGVILRNFCIDMDTAAANDPLYGIQIGGATSGTTVNKFVEIEHVSIYDAGASGGAGVKLGSGNSSTSDTAFLNMHDVYMSGVQTCVIIDGGQVIGNEIKNLACANPVAAIGGISFGQYGGGATISHFYMTPGVVSQIGINIRGEAIGPVFIEKPAFEWDKDDGTYIKFDPQTNFGAYRATTIIGGRFQPQVTPGSVVGGGKNRCISFSRQGSLNLIGNSFESNNAAWTCQIDLAAPNTSAAAEKTTDVVFIGNDLQWAGDQVSSSLVVNRTAASHASLRVSAIEKGSIFSCLTSAGGSVTGQALSVTSTGCSGLGTYTIGTSAPTDGVTACTLGDSYLDESANKMYWCVDSATDDWFGVALTDTP